MTVEDDRQALTRCVREILASASSEPLPDTLMVSDTPEMRELAAGLEAAYPGRVSVGVPQLNQLQFARACELLDLLGPHATIAGGWVRDALMGEQARDVDVLVTTEHMDGVLARLQAVSVGELETKHRNVLEAPPLDPDQEMSFCNGVLSITTMIHVGKHGPPIEVQIIEVADVLAHIDGIDAHCNMLYLDAKANVHSASPFAVSHALGKIWEPNPGASCGAESMAARAAKFKARGYEIRKPPEQSALDFEGLL